MHGYFLSLKLYTTARLIANPQSYAEYRDRVVSDRLAAKAESRIRAKKDQPKVNKALAERLRRVGEREEAMEKKKRERMGIEPDGAEEREMAGASGVLADPRFKEVFENPDFEVDEESREYALLNPATVNNNVSRLWLLAECLMLGHRQSGRRRWMKKMRRVTNRPLVSGGASPKAGTGLEARTGPARVTTGVSLFLFFPVHHLTSCRSITIRPPKSRAVRARAPSPPRRGPKPSSPRRRRRRSPTTQTRDLWSSSQLLFPLNQRQDQLLSPARWCTGDAPFDRRRYGDVVHPPKGRSERGRAGRVYGRDEEEGSESRAIRGGDGEG